MTTKALIADDDMDAHRLLYDLIEINFRSVIIERALSAQSFWAKIALGEANEPKDLIFVSSEYIKEDPHGFINRLKETNADAVNKIIVTGSEQDFKDCGEAVNGIPFLAKPFSLDEFVETVKNV